MDVTPPTIDQEDALIRAVVVSVEARMETLKAAVTACRASRAFREVAQDLMREEYERQFALALEGMNFSLIFRWISSC